jgi:hypothetical protein
MGVKSTMVLIELCHHKESSEMLSVHILWQFLDGAFMTPIVRDIQTEPVAALV